jgi:hypothetical protein
LPEHYFSTVDRDFNTELKHEWRTKFFQYGKMFRSLEQSTLIQDYYSRYNALYNRALTPSQINDYFWMLYKPYKKNKYSKFFKNYDTLDREDSMISKQKILNWENKIRNPSSINELEIFNDNYGYKNYNYEVPNLSKNWLSVYLKKKMSQKRQNFSLNQFETYSGPELSFENINTKSLIKKIKILVGFLKILFWIKNK